jgi:ABC-type nickel/cobalt efflux system permease component RcnA
VISFAAILILSFFLGMRHATDPDHVVAITTIITRQRGVAKAALIGALWGLGHTFTIFVVGTIIILFQVTIPPRLGLSMEFAVAAMLILLGVLNLTGTLRRWQEKFTPSTTIPGATIVRGVRDLTKLEPVGSSSATSQPDSVILEPSKDRISQRVGLYNVIRPLVIGIVHGLAGSAAVALLVMTTIRDSWWAIAYLLLFGVGTIAGMMLITAVIAMPFAFTIKKFAGWNRGIAVASGLLSLGFGLFLSYQIGLVDGLFTLHPHWIPR